MIPVIGKHDYSGACAPGGDNLPAWHTRWHTFSVGVFEWVPSSTKRPKKSLVKVRVKGATSDPDRVYAVADKIVAELDAGTYSSPKTVTVPWRAEESSS